MRGSQRVRVREWRREEERAREKALSNNASSHLREAARDLNYRPEK